MRLVRFITMALFGVSLAAWVFTGVWAERKLDREAPVITAESDTLQLSIEDGKEKLMEGLSAKDNKDGNLTGEIFTGSHSKFSKPGVFDMTYLVFDSSNNLGQYTREVEYTDYRKPEFDLNGPLVFGLNENTAVLSSLKLNDAIDGDISDKIKIVSSEIDKTVAGVYKVGVEGTSAYGDRVSVELPVNIVDHRKNAPEIVLSKYLVYLNQGAEFNPRTYVDKVLLSSGVKAVDAYTVEIDNQVNTGVPGCYNVLFSYTDEAGVTGYTSMAVIVFEQEER